MRKTLLLQLISLVLFTDARAQGCSDAGVCTAGPIGQLPAMGDSASARPPRHFARLVFSYASGEQGVTILQVVPKLGFGITDRLGVQFKIPYVSASGNLGDNSGVGDPTLTASYAILNDRRHRLDGVAGIKLNANKADASTTEGLSLPMPYQTSLGTTDLLLGVNYRRGRINAAVAYQHVLANNNANAFFGPAGIDSVAAIGYFPSAELQRANDAVVRVQYAIPLGKLAVQPGLLAITHLQNDSRLTISQGGSAGPPATTTERVDIGGSSGLTLNLTADARYTITDAWAVEASFGTPMITRDTRPDGLTRSMVLNIGVRAVF